MNKLAIVLLSAILTLGIAAKANAEELNVSDINQDHIVNIVDLSIFLSSYNQNAVQCTNHPQFVCDLNNDLKIDVTDLSILLSNYGTKY
jgi:hypothetical protein